MLFPGMSVLGLSFLARAFVPSPVLLLPGSILIVQVCDGAIIAGFCDWAAIVRVYFWGDQSRVSQARSFQGLAFAFDMSENMRLIATVARIGGADDDRTTAPLGRSANACVRCVC